MGKWERDLGAREPEGVEDADPKVLKEPWGLEKRRWRGVGLDGGCSQGSGGRGKQEFGCNGEVWSAGITRRQQQCRTKYQLQCRTK